MDFLFDRAEETLGLKFSDKARRDFGVYCDALLETNRVMNLTAITEPDQVYLRHFIDSAATLLCGGFEGASVIDVGCGAGFPGLPMKLVQPKLELTMLDSLGKRITFLEGLCASLEVDARAIHGRAEEEARKEDMRECFDFAVSRAVASLPMLCELCLPFVKVGGKFIALKAQDYAEELEQAESAIETLGAQVQEVRSYTLPDSDVTRVLIVIGKKNPTPEAYPRRFAKIQKKPL